MPYTSCHDEGAAQSMTELADTFDAAFSKAVDLGNRIADKDKDADLWDIADGLLAGAIQYGSIRDSRGDPRRQDACRSAPRRGAWLNWKCLIEQLARERIFPHADRRQRRPRLSAARGPTP
jgi:hypothetical protein